MKPVIVFDLDDTLYAERDFVLSGFGAVGDWLQQNGTCDGFATEASRLFEKGVRGKIFDQALARLGVGVRPELIDALVEVYRAHEPRLHCYPDAQRALDHWQGRAHLGVITDGYAATQRQKIKALGLETRVDCVICTDDLGRDHWKPSALAFQRMMERFGQHPSTCLYVADNPAKDFVAPKRLGWWTIQIHREQGVHRFAWSGLPADYLAQRAIGSLDELAAIVTEDMRGITPQWA